MCDCNTRELIAIAAVFWSWFPLGLTGIRTLLLFICCLAVFILRVAQLHIGARTAPSEFDAFWQCAWSRNVAQTLFWYLSSAFLFCEVYIFSTAQGANLAWVDPGRSVYPKILWTPELTCERSYERPRLNERPVFLRSLYVCLAVAQTGAHLYGDYDRIKPHKTKLEPTPVTGSPQSALDKSYQPISQIRDALGGMVQRSLLLAILTALMGPFVYFVFMRQIAWSMAFAIGRTMFSLTKSARPSGLTDLSSLMARFVGSSFLLAFLWEVSNRAFSIFASAEPLKKGLPLTTDSKDPNGSLITGLKAKRNIPRSMAFWELATITARFEDRRKTLYQDFDRRGGSTWSQILTPCLVEIQGVSKRIQDFQNPSANAAPASQQPQQVQTLPKISQPLKQDNILNASPRPSSAFEAVSGGVGAVAKAYGQSAAVNPASTQAQKLLEYGTNRVLSKEQQQQLSSSGLTKRANGYALQVLRSPVGIIFRQSFRRRINTIVFGGPFSHAGTIEHAVQALCKLAVCSLREDSYGQVQKDIPTIIRVLVSTIQSAQFLLQTLPPHWTDVEFDQKRQVKEVDELLETMTSGLEQVLISFGEYADALGLSRAELRAAKEAVRKGPEMEARKKR